MALLKKETPSERQQRARMIALARSGGVNQPLDAMERAFNRDMTRIFGSQMTEAVRAKIWDTAEYGMFMSAEWSEQISFMAEGYISMRANVQAGAEIAKLEIGMSDFIERPGVIAAIQDESLLFASKLGKSTTQAITNQLTQGIERGESIPEMKKRLQTVFGFAGDERKENWRAERVVRTEVARAQTIGQREYWKQTGVVESVVWDANGDACPFCLEMQGKTVSINEVFFDEGDSLTVPFNGKDINMGFNYSVIAGPPLHPNCFLHHSVPIITDEGRKDICDIKVGDRVLTARGRFRPVTSVLDSSPRYQGPAVSIHFRRKSKDKRNMMIVTPEHPFLTARGWVAAKDMMELDTLFVLSQPCERCGKLTPYWKNYCSRHCAMDDPVTKQKISDSKKGDKNWMYGKTGKDHHLWRGGKIWWRGKEWDTLKRKIVERDGFVCQDCGMTEVQCLEKSKQPLHVHHINPYRDSHNNSSENLVTLCVSCHAIREGTVNSRFLLSGGAAFKEIPILGIEYLPEHRGERLYNFAVEEDESYVAHGIVSHNCRCALTAELAEPIGV